MSTTSHGLPTVSERDRALSIFGETMGLVAITCLFAAAGHDLRALVRSGAGDEELGAAVAAVWRPRADRYSELRTKGTDGLPKVEMSYIGG